VKIREDRVLNRTLVRPSESAYTLGAKGTTIGVKDRIKMIDILGIAATLRESKSSPPINRPPFSI